jgi:hypothetical protein
MIPYEYHNEQLGIRANVLISGEDADPSSLVLIGERGLRHRIENGYIKRLRMRGPNTPALVKWDTLPRDWQKLLVETFGEPQRQVRQSLFERHYSRDSVAIEFYTNYQLQDGKFLPDAVIDEYTLNASVLNTAETIYKKRYELRKSLRGGVADIWTIVTNECNRFRDIQGHTLPANAASLRRKLKEYQKESYEALIHGNFCNKSALKVDESVINLLNSMFAYQSDKPTATQISRQYDSFLSGYVKVINSETGEVYDPKEFPKLSPATITNYLAKWSSKVGTHTIRSGNRQIWMSKFRSFHDMKQPEYSGSIISIDDRQPPFEYAKGKRMWFYNGIDLGSEAFTTWVYGQTKEGIIDDFYRQMVRNYIGWGFNLPAELEGEMSLNSKFLNTFLEKGTMFQFTHIEANNARGKRIERYYGNLRYNIEKEREGWLARPFALSESNQAGPKAQPFIPYDQLAEGCLKDIETWNNMEHSKIKGKTRWEVFTEKQNPNILPTNWRAFLPYIGWKTETSCNLGQISLNNKKYLIGENGKLVFSDRLIGLMTQIEGKDLDVYWLDGNDGQIMKALVYLRGTDRCVCEAVAKPSHNKAQIERTPEDIENYTAMSMYVSSVDKFIRTQKNKIDRVTVIDNTPKTLNNKFQISGLRKPITERVGPVEIMEDVEEEDDIFKTISPSFNKSLKDRF